MRTCNTCGQTKPLEEFYKHPTASGGLCYACKVCMRRYSKAYTTQHPPDKRNAEERRAARKKYNDSERGKAYNRAYQKTHRKTPRAIQRAREKTRLAVAKNKEWINELKLQKGCVDCGYKTHPHALDFDHLPGHTKSFEISRSKVRSQQQLLAEISKCELVCANCHRIRTSARRREAEIDAVDLEWDSL